jgi:hypothetical protein
VVAQALRFKQFSWYSPKPNPNDPNQSISGLGGDIMFAPRSPGLASNTPTIGQFSCTVDGVVRAFNGGIFASGYDIPFTLVAPAITIGQKVVMNYTPNGAIKLQDTAGNLVPAFSTPIRNVLG